MSTSAGLNSATGFPRWRKPVGTFRASSWQANPNSRLLLRCKVFHFLGTGTPLGGALPRHSIRTCQFSKSSARVHEAVCTTCPLEDSFVSQVAGHVGWVQNWIAEPPWSTQ
jgi:hypothetical protein